MIQMRLIGVSGKEEGRFCTKFINALKYRLLVSGARLTVVTDGFRWSV